MIKLLLFGTQGCHLCEQAEALLEACQADFLIEKIDIAEPKGADYRERYELRIPVLYHEQTGRGLCWPFDRGDLEAFLIALTHA